MNTKSLEFKNKNIKNMRKNIKLTPAIFIAAIFSLAIGATTDANAQSANNKDKVCAVTQSEQSLGDINAEILALEKELANIELIAKQNNIDLGKTWSYIILNKVSTASLTEEKATAKN